jgi:tetratricopeptide (TPR) repeat protein
MRSVKIKESLWGFSLLIPLLLYSFGAIAQSERKLVRDGNKQYESGKYSDAEINYRKSLDKNKSSYTGTYNLGDALYQQKKFDEAASHFNSSASLTRDKKSLSKTYHNLGNALVESKKYEESVQAYKNALKLNPEDNDTRYNLAYAQSMLKQQQQQQRQQNKDNKDNKDKKDQQQQQQEKDKKDQQQQQKQDQKDQQAKQQQQQQQKISKEDAERILKALKNNENDLQKKLAKKEGEKVRIDKQW